MRESHAREAMVVSTNGAEQRASGRRYNLAACDAALNKTRVTWTVTNRDTSPKKCQQQDSQSQPRLSQQWRPVLQKSILEFIVFVELQHSKI